MATALHRPNVLYAVSHDLRHDVASSALDSIVSDSGCRFTMAFAQAPYCAPSRNSFFTGRRTTATGVHTFDAHDAVREISANSTQNSPTNITRDDDFWFDSLSTCSVSWYLSSGSAPTDRTLRSRLGLRGPRFRRRLPMQTTALTARASPWRASETPPAAALVVGARATILIGLTERSPTLRPLTSRSHTQAVHGCSRAQLVVASAQQAQQASPLHQCCAPFS